jgi:hypothetical protein
LNALADIFNKREASNPKALSKLVRKNQFRIRVDARPKPKVAFAFLRLSHASGMATHVLPLSSTNHVIDSLGALRQSFDRRTGVKMF